MVKNMCNESWFKKNSVPQHPPSKNPVLMIGQAWDSRVRLKSHEQGFKKTSAVCIFNPEWKINGRDREDRVRKPNVKYSETLPNFQYSRHSGFMGSSCVDSVSLGSNIWGENASVLNLFVFFCYFLSNIVEQLFISHLYYIT